jgi:hypothetical protein
VGIKSTVFLDLSKSEVLVEVNKIGIEIHLDLFICVVLSHGTQGSQFNCFDHQELCIKSDIMNRFESCPNLQKSTKIYFANFCRVYDGEESHSPLLEPIKHTNTMLIFSTLPGTKSYRSNVNGSIFIQELVKIIRDNYFKYDLIHIIHETNKALQLLLGEERFAHSGYEQAVHFESFNVIGKIYLYPTVLF